MLTAATLFAHESDDLRGQAVKLVVEAPGEGQRRDEIRAAGAGRAAARGPRRTARRRHRRRKKPSRSPRSTPRPWPEPITTLDELTGEVLSAVRPQRGPPRGGDRGTDHRGAGPLRLAGPGSGGERAGAGRSTSTRGWRTEHVRLRPRHAPARPPLRVHRDHPSRRPRHHVRSARSSRRWGSRRQWRAAEALTVGRRSPSSSRCGCTRSRKAWCTRHARRWCPHRPRCPA